MFFHKNYKNKIIHLKNTFFSIGDMVCSFPAMANIAKEAKKVYIDIAPYHEYAQNKMEELFELFPKKYNVEKYHDNIICDETVIIPGPAGEYSKEYMNDKIHMTQVNFKYSGQRIPKCPVQPEMQIPYIKTESYDYLIAPYAYSLMQPDYLSREIWQELIDAFPNRTFGIFGQSNHDFKFLSGKNITYVFDRSYIEVANIMRRSGPLISVITGLSHLAYALGTPHIQLTNQTFWSINPNAIARVESKPICFLPAKFMIKLLQKIENGERNIIIPKDFNYVQNEI
jgi:hypothetical protein